MFTFMALFLLLFLSQNIYIIYIHSIFMSLLPSFHLQLKEKLFSAFSHRLKRRHTPHHMSRHSSQNHPLPAHPPGSLKKNEKGKQPILKTQFLSFLVLFLILIHTTGSNTHITGGHNIKNT